MAYKYKIELNYGVRRDIIVKCIDEMEKVPDVKVGSLFSNDITASSNSFGRLTVFINKLENAIKVAIRDRYSLTQKDSKIMDKAIKTLDLKYTTRDDCGAVAFYSFEEFEREKLIKTFKELVEILEKKGISSQY